MGEHYVYQAEPTTVNTAEAAHTVIKGDPKHDGPYLDDVRALEEQEYRKNRTKNLRAHDKKVRAASGKKKAALQEEAALPPVDTEHRSPAPGEKRAVRDVVDEVSKSQPRQRPLSTPSHAHAPEDNTPKPKLEDAKVPPRLVSKATVASPNRKSTAKKTAAKKTAAKKSTAKKPVAKKKAAAGKKK